MGSFPDIIYRTDAPGALDIAPQGTICRDSKQVYYIQMAADDEMIWYECNNLEDALRIKQNLTQD